MRGRKSEGSGCGSDAAGSVAASGKPFRDLGRPLLAAGAAPRQNLTGTTCRAAQVGHDAHDAAWLWPALCLLHQTSRVCTIERGRLAKSHDRLCKALTKFTCASGFAAKASSSVVIRAGFTSGRSIAANAGPVCNPQHESRTEGLLVNNPGYFRTKVKPGRLLCTSLSQVTTVSAQLLMFSQQRHIANHLCIQMGATRREVTWRWAAASTEVAAVRTVASREPRSPTHQSIILRMSKTASPNSSTATASHPRASVSTCVPCKLQMHLSQR